MRKPIVLVVVLLLLLLAGCKELGNVRMTQDQPEDIQQLLKYSEFARVRHLMGKHPGLDTPELRDQLRTQESGYENTIFRDAYKLESENDLFGAVQLLSSALQKVPNSTTLQEYRNRLEGNRLEKIWLNDRQQLIARAEYIFNQRMYYKRQHKLQAPDLIQRLAQARNDKESENLAVQLRDHGENAIKQDDIQAALEYLQLSKKLDDSPETRVLLDSINTKIDTQQHVAQQQASLKKVKKQVRIKQIQTNKTGKLLEETRQALSDNDLSAARALFMQIPADESTSADVRLLQDELNLAVNTRVTQLTSRGDKEYRADDVITAIRTWSVALALDPENQNLNERLERAGRVLAKLEQLKQIQGK